MKAVYTVGHKVYTPGAKDAHGNPVEAWADPVDLDVYAIAPATSQEPGADRLAVTTGLSLLVPLGAVVGPHDRFLIDGVEWKVEGDVADWSRNPFGYDAGLSVSLTREEG